ncbi:hypothetical protein A1D31_39135 [Bradyrhizobium liaoningense]|nr:hypothetical protein A1D31_39135 [Bradyrhizobium liaoningense]
MAVASDPTSKIPLFIAAYGAKKAGDELGQIMLDQAQQRFLSGVSGALKRENYTPDELNSMDHARLAEAIETAKIQEQAFRDVLQNEPDALELVKRSAFDRADNTSTAALLGISELKGDVQQIAAELGDTARQIESLQKETEGRLDVLTSQMKEMHALAEESKRSLNSLRQDVAASRKATQTLAQVSFLGWTTEQKLEAVKSDMFPDLTPTQASSLRRSLEADLKRETIARDTQRAARNIGEIANIASNLGVDPKVVTGLAIAQTGATAVAQYFSGDYIGMVSSATSLLGVGKPSAAAQQHKAMMGYLDEQFRQINQKLNEIIELQKQTLLALDQLAGEMRELRADVRRVEFLVLLNHDLLKKLVQAEWEDCWSLVGSMRGVLTITRRNTLVELLGDDGAKNAIQKCHGVFLAKLGRWRQARAWSEEIIDARQFATLPGEEADKPKSEAGEEYVKYIKALDATSGSVRVFLSSEPTVNASSPGRLLARFSQPLVSKSESDGVARELDSIEPKLKDFTCNRDKLLSVGLQNLICWGVERGRVAPPQANAWQELVAGTQLGPNAPYLIDLAIALSTLIDLAVTSETNTRWDFVSPDEIDISSGVSRKLIAAVEQRKGLRLLQELSTLTDAYALQQSVLNGDYLAELLAEALYDPKDRTLVSKLDPTTPNNRQAAALAVMKANPIVARNVVMLAMRRALAESGYILPDGETYYTLALNDYKGPPACLKDTYVTAKLSRLLPKWEFTYIAPPDERGTADKPGPLIQCAEQVDAEQGWGLAVQFDGFYVKVPSPRILSEGTYEYPSSLRVALAYRERLNLALLDRGFVTTTQFQRRFGNDGAFAASVLTEAKRALSGP